MKPRCKVGDLAFIVRPGDVPRNVGKLVKVVAPSSGMSRLCGGDWLVESCSGPLDACLVDRHIQVDALDYPDSYLCPIRPDADAVSVHQLDEVTA